MKCHVIINTLNRYDRHDIHILRNKETKENKNKEDTSKEEKDKDKDKKWEKQTVVPSLPAGELADTLKRTSWKINNKK